MELDDLKKSWLNYDKKLADNLKVNEELLKKMNLDSSRKELSQPLKYEIFSATVLFVLAAILIAASLRVAGEPKFLISGVVGAIVTVAYLGFSLIKIKGFMRFDYYDSSVLQLQKDLSRLKLCILKLRKYELVLLPVLVISLLPILFKTVHNMDIYQNMTLMIIEIVAILGVGFPVTLWINKYLYDRKLKNTETFLKEIENFESEE